MRIAVNTRFLLKGKLEGIGWFSYETLKRIVQNHPEHQFIFLFDRPFDQEFIFAKNVEGRVITPPAKHPLLWYWWFERSLPKVLKKIGADVFLSPDGYLSLKTKVPTLMVMHDLAFEHFEDHIPSLVKRYYRHYSPKFAERAERIATVSRFSKEDIIKQYGIRETKIDVVFNGASNQYFPMNGTTSAGVKEKFTQGKDYLLYAGSIHPRKNVGNLLKAYELFRQRAAEPIKLLIAGRKAWKSGDIQQIYNAMKYKEDVVFSGYLNVEELSKVTASARAMVYPSLFEGFGIPILESLKCEVPVVTSNVSSMPEVVGDAGLLIDPEQPQEIAEAMYRISFDDPLRKRLREKAKEQGAKFSWDQTAERLWMALEKVMERI